MKLLLATLISLFSLVSTTKASDNDPRISAAVLSSFNSAFKNAAEVKWTASENFSKAEFSLRGQYVAAYYDVAVNLIDLTRNISSFQLPITLQTKLKTSYESYWISDLFELSDDNGTSYYVTVENGDPKITLKSNGTNEWSVYQKQRKS